MKENGSEADPKEFPRGLAHTSRLVAAFDHPPNADFHLIYQRMRNEDGHENSCDHEGRLV